MINTNKHVIDLTAGLSDLEASSHDISSAKKRSRRGSDSGFTQRYQKKVKKVGLIGRPFHTSDKEKHYRAIPYGGLLIEVDTKITCPRGKALVRRITETRRSSDGKCFDGKPEIGCHVQWLEQSACGNKDELFLVHGVCANVRLSSIVSVEPIDIGARGPIADRPWLRHVFQHAYNVWRDPILADGKGNPLCDSCASANEAPQEEYSYHLFDSVLFEEKVITPGSTTLVWRVGRIVQVDSTTINVQLFERFSDRARLINDLAVGYVSERRLVLSQLHRRIDISNILGRAHVAHDPTLPYHTGFTQNFYCNDRLRENGEIIALSKPLPACIACTTSLANTERDYKLFMSQVKLPAIDYYSGAGGGMIGAKGYFHHAHAVEMDDHACTTLKENFRKTRVHHTMVGEASKAAREIDKADSRERGKALPGPGSMVLASAGPPCQGHSGANHQNKMDDPRNSELFVTIEEVRRLKPDIFILENVPGMKRDRDLGDGEASNYAVEGIKRLRDIGYQCQMVQLDARSFGSPQNRIRLFLICARQGIPLPSVPQPTHINPHIERNIFAGASNSSRTFYVGDKGSRGSAPFPSINVRDAISDLPQFEYLYLYEKSQSRSTQIPKFNPLKAERTRVGFLQPTPYRTPPANDFQTRQRAGGNEVENHYTPPRTSRELDLIFASDAFVGQTTPSDTPGNCRRINPDRGASTLLTSSGPDGKYTGPIHYDQSRTLTVAERKRLQGVPDRYHICGSVESKDRQVGNMINVNLSRALHGHIHREVFFKAWLDMGKPNNFLERWRTIHPI